MGENRRENVEEMCVWWGGVPLLDRVGNKVDMSKVGWNY